MLHILFIQGIALNTAKGRIWTKKCSTQPYVYWFFTLSYINILYKVPFIHKMILWNNVTGRKISIVENYSCATKSLTHLRQKRENRVFFYLLENNQMYFSYILINIIWAYKIIIHYIKKARKIHFFFNLSNLYWQTEIKRKKCLRNLVLFYGEGTREQRILKKKIDFLDFISSDIILPVYDLSPLPSWIPI